MKESIQYHPGFIGGLGVLLWKYREKIDIDPEKWISKQGIRMDVLILKKDPEVVLDNDMCRIFRGHNILEYKRPSLVPVTVTAVCLECEQNMNATVL